MGQPGFWDSQEQALEVVGRLKSLTAVVKPLSELIRGGEDLVFFPEASPSTSCTPTSGPPACSGDMYRGVPKSWPV